MLQLKQQLRQVLESVLVQFGVPKGLTKYLILEEPLEIDWIEITPAGGTSKQSERWDFGGNHSRK